MSERRISLSGSRSLGTYLRPGVLVVDEVGYQPLEPAEANLVFQVISKRYEKGPIILTSNKTSSEWGQVFGDEVLATAILDRLRHHCDVICLNGPPATGSRIGSPPSNATPTRLDCLSLRSQWVGGFTRRGTGTPRLRFRSLHPRRGPATHSCPRLRG